MTSSRMKLMFAFLLIIIVISSPVRSDTEPGRIKVLSFNIWGIIKADQRVVRIKAIAERIAKLDPDILAIQEAFAYRHRRALKKALEKAGYPVDNWRYFRRYYGSGILFISKFPIEKTVWERYAVNGAWNDIEWLGGKGIAYFRVKTPWGPLDFFTTHAIARMTPFFDKEGNYIEGDYNEIDRHIHMYQIDRFIRRQRNENGRSIITAGDFNVAPIMPEYRLLVAMTGFENSYDVLNPGQNPSTYSIGNPYVESESSRIDHIFFKNYKGAKGFWLKPVVSRVEMNEKFISPKTSSKINYSDHYGMWTEFEVVTEETEIKQSPRGAGSIKPGKCDGSKLTGYSEGKITLTGENVEAWRNCALDIFYEAYKRKNRKNPLLIPMADILVKSRKGLPATIVIRHRHRAILEEKICAGPCSNN